MDLALEIQKTNVGIRISILQIDIMGVNFESKQTTLNFLVQIWPKMDLGLVIEKTNLGIRISILKIFCVPIFCQNGQFRLSWAKFGQKWIQDRKFRKKFWNKNQHRRDTMCANFQEKSGNFNFFGPNFPKNGFWSCNFKNLSKDLKFAPPRYYVG